MKLVFLALNLAALLVSGATQAAPGSQIKYYGYYNYYWGGEGDPLNLPLLASQSNLVPVAPYYKDTGVIAINQDQSLTTQLAAIKAAGMKAMVYVGPIFAEVNVAISPPSQWGNPAVRERWYPLNQLADPNSARFQALWAKFLADIGPYQDTIGAFYLEEAYWGVAWQLISANSFSPAAVEQQFSIVNSNLNYIGTRLKNHFSGIPIMLVEAPPVFPGNYPVGNSLVSCPACTNAMQIPAVIDWVGYEGGYATAVSSADPSVCTFDRCFGMSMPQISLYAKAKLNPNQRLVLVPPAFVPSTNATAQDYSNMQGVMSAFFKMAINDPAVVAVVPYHWTAPSSSADLGLGDQISPTLRSLAANFGSCLLGKATPILCPQFFQGLQAGPSANGSLPGGFFEVAGGTLIDSNGAGHFCAFSDPSAYLAAGGPSDTSRLMVFNAWPSQQVNDGICAGSVLPNLSSGFYMVAGGTIIYANGQGHYCEFDNWDFYLSVGGPSQTSSLPFLNTLPTYQTDDGICAK